MCGYALIFKTSFHEHWEAELPMQQFSLPPLVCWVLATQATSAGQRGSLHSSAADSHRNEEQLLKKAFVLWFTSYIYALSFSTYFSYAKNKCNHTRVRREEAERALLTRKTAHRDTAAPLTHWGFPCNYCCVSLPKATPEQGILKRFLQAQTFPKNIYHRNLLAPLIHKVQTFSLSPSSASFSLALSQTFF